MKSFAYLECQIRVAIDDAELASIAKEIESSSMREDYKEELRKKLKERSNGIR